jgi:hypothetical protein
MTDFDVYYKGMDSTGGKYAGTILHVCLSGAKVGTGMVPPRVLKITVTCEEADVAAFWIPNYAERYAATDKIAEPPIDGLPAASLLLLKTRFLVDVTKHKNCDKITLAELKTVDRLPAARVASTLGIKIDG